MLLIAIGSVEDDVFAERDRARRSFLSRKRKPRDEHAMRKTARIEADAEKQVRLAEKLGPHNDTFKNRYYLEKFGIAPPAKGESESDVKVALCREYLRGLSWVLKYYYGGVASWEWYVSCRVFIARTTTHTHSNMETGTTLSITHLWPPICFPQHARNWTSSISENRFFLSSNSWDVYHPSPATFCQDRIVSS